MAAPAPFNREKFLFRLLAGIFFWQGAIFSGAVIGCFRIGVKDACPNLGDRYENTVNVMVATTLALLGAGAVAGATASAIKGEPKKAEPQNQEPKKEDPRSSWTMGSDSGKKP